jgi:energy-coupling factor transporter transmembrane protein EcfT
MLNTLIVIFLIFFFYGIGLKLVSMLITVVSYPTYIAVYAFEYCLNYKTKNLTERKIFRLNIPKSNPKKVWMDSLASIVTVLSTDIAIKMTDAIENIEFQIDFITKMMNGTLISYYISLPILVCMIIIYVISYSSDIDERTAYKKLESLSIPALLLKQIK